MSARSCCSKTASSFLHPCTGLKKPIRSECAHIFSIIRSCSIITMDLVTCTCFLWLHLHRRTVSFVHIVSIWCLSLLKPVLTDPVSFVCKHTRLECKNTSLSGKCISHTHTCAHTQNREQLSDMEAERGRPANKQKLGTRTMRNVTLKNLLLTRQRWALV